MVSLKLGCLDRDSMIEFQCIPLLGSHERSLVCRGLHVVGKLLDKAQVTTHQLNRETINDIVGDIIEILLVGQTNVAADDGAEGGELFLGELFHLLGPISCPLNLIENGPLRSLPIVAHGPESKLNALCGFLLDRLVLNVCVGSTLNY